MLALIMETRNGDFALRILMLSEEELNLFKLSLNLSASLYTLFVFLSVASTKVAYVVVSTV